MCADPPLWENCLLLSMTSLDSALSSYLCFPCCQSCLLICLGDGILLSLIPSVSAIKAAHPAVTPKFLELLELLVGNGCPL